VLLTSEVSELAERVLTVLPAALGPRLGPDTQLVIAAVRRGQWTDKDGAVVVEGITLEPGEYALALRPRQADSGRALPGDTGVVVLDTAVDDDLEAEGHARDVVRDIQSARRDAGLHVADRITVHVTAPAPVIAALERHRQYVMEQTLADDLVLELGDEYSVAVSRRR
jgi:isoleucyl-tRNA synthetase